MRRLHLVPLLVAAAALVAACTPAPSPDPFFTIRCPVTGTVSFSNDWHAPRAGGRLHEGNDIMAPRNTPVVAVVDGTFRQSLGTLQGNGAWVQGESGNTFFYAHFDHYNGNNRRVKAGDVIGFVGNTGDAAGGPTHTHFEIHPGGGAAVNPYRSLTAACTNRREAPPVKTTASL